MSNNFKTPHNYKGVLIAVEGTDGSGKSTQMYLLKKWLESEGYGTVFTEWNSSNLVSNVIKKGKKKDLLNNTTFSLLHATDFADRLHKIIIPALKDGSIVLADRYFYTALARDVARDCDPAWLRNTYSFSIRPDAVFYFKVPVEISLERITMTRKPKYYEAGMDMKLSTDPFKSYLLFQSRVIEEYEKMVKEFGLDIIDGTESIPDQQVIFRKKIIDVINRRANAGK
ncbi:MAG: dTMP kinase [Candidatus Margulisbacteria bacterium GWF2_35_9]|nr:MAG: dTMP kinase [Candidatus Margulisbacteria bacterium GWF2_35_9]